MYFDTFISYMCFCIFLIEQRYYAQLGKVVRETQAALSELHQQEVRVKHKIINYTFVK